MSDEIEEIRKAAREMDALIASKGPVDPFPAADPFREEQCLPVWQSYVWHEGRCFFVSTINRMFHTSAGSMRGLETIVWECDPKTRERGEMLGQAEGLEDHQKLCRSLIADGTTSGLNKEFF